MPTTRRVVVLVAAVLGAIDLIGCGAKSSTTTAPVATATQFVSIASPAPGPSATEAVTASPSPSPSPTPVLLTMPNEVGKNAAVALDELKNLGFTNVELGTVDGHSFVVLPANWTVKKQSAKAGTRLAADAKIVLGCAKNG